MTPEQIAKKYVHGMHDALTDNQEKLYMVADIEEYAKQKDERIKELETRIAMLNKCIDNNESNHDYAIATDSVRIYLNDPIETFYTTPVDTIRVKPHYKNPLI